MIDSEILNVDEHSFDQTIRQFAGPVLVDFWASWCGPCKALVPTLAAVASELGGRARIVKVNVEDSGDLANRFGVRSIPTLMVFKNGRVVDQMIGNAPKDQIRALVERHLDGQSTVA